MEEKDFEIRKSIIESYTTPPGSSKRKPQRSFSVYENTIAKNLVKVLFFVCLFSTNNIYYNVILKLEIFVEEKSLC